MPSDDLFSKLADFDLLYLSGITLAILSADVRARLFEFLKNFRLEGGIVAFDSNYRKQLWDDIGTSAFGNNDHVVSDRYCLAIRR